MNSRWFLRLTVFAVIATLVAGCGNRINKRDLGADEYFEYAKKKYDDGDYLGAITEFTVITLKFSGNPVVDDAQYYLAESHYKQNEFLIAISEYEKLINDYPQSPYAVLAQFKVGLANYEMSLRPALDQSFTRSAMRKFQEFIEENPGHSLTPEAEKKIMAMREKLASKQLLGATTYRKMGIYDSAVIYYDIILERYYDTAVVAEAMFYRAECLYKLEKYLEAQTGYTAYLERFPEDDHVGDARSRLGEIIDKLDAANEAPESARLDD